MTHQCIGNLTIIFSDNGLSPSRRQAIIWTNAGILLIGPLGTNFNEFLIEIHGFLSTKIHSKKSSGKWRPFCLGLTVLIANWQQATNCQGMLNLIKDIQVKKIYPHTRKYVHDDVIKWKHFPHYWPFVQGIHRSLVNSPHKGQWRGALMFSLIYAWTNAWVHNCEAGDLRCHHTHYDVTVMMVFLLLFVLFF